MVRFVAGGNSFDVPEEFVSLTTYFKDIQEFEGSKDEFVLNTISKEDLTRVLEAAKIAAYKFNQVTKVNSNDSRAFIGEGLTNFFSSLKNTELNSLFKAAKELRLKGLQNNIAAFISTKLWIKLTLNDYNEKRKELGITEELTPDRSKVLKEKCPFLN